MKTAVLIVVTLFSSLLLSAQEISDVRTENGWIVVYDSGGSRVSSMSDAFNNKVVAITGSFFVTNDGSMITTYDAKCSRLGSMFSSGKTILSATGSTFTVRENSFTVTYDSKCSRLSSFAPVNLLEISDVRIENSMIVVYNTKGDKISSMFNSLDKRIVGKTATFFVVQDDFHIETYNAQCKLIGSTSSFNKVVRGAVGSTFTTEENGWIVTYDSRCNRISSRMKE